MKKFRFVGLFCFAFFLISCFAKQPVDTAEKKATKRVIVNKFLLILGQDYYERDGILDYLRGEYELGSANSKVDILPYSEMVNSKNNLYLRSIYDKVKKLTPNVVISIGAPEGAGRYFIKLREEFPDIVFISLLPMEDILPLEASCEIVVDYELPDDLLNEEKDFIISDEDVQLLLLSAVFASEDIVAHKNEAEISPYNEFNRAFFIAQAILFKEGERKLFRVKPYVDPETSLPSRKYLIIYEKKVSDDLDEPVESADDKDGDEQADEEDDVLNPDELEGSP